MWIVKPEKRTRQTPLASGYSSSTYRWYVNPRCFFFAALLIIDHLITIHYSSPLLYSRFCLSPLALHFLLCCQIALFLHWEKEQTERKKETEHTAREGNFFFLSRSTTDGHLHIGPLIDKHTGGALRNEGPPPFVWRPSFLYFFNVNHHCPLTHSSGQRESVVSRLLSRYFCPSFFHLLSLLCTHCASLRKKREKKKEKRGREREEWRRITKPVDRTVEKYES